MYKYLDILRAACGLVSSSKSNPGSFSLEGYHYSEISALADIHFRFSEKVRAESYVSDVAAAMNRPYAREHILSGAARVWQWDEAAIKELLDLLRPENSRVLLMGREFPKVTDEISGDEDRAWKKDKWYTTEYRVFQLENGVLRCTTPGASSSESIPQLYLPEPNDFIPSALSVEKAEVAVVSFCFCLTNNYSNLSFISISRAKRPLESEIRSFLRFGSRKMINFGFQKLVSIHMLLRMVS